MVLIVALVITFGANAIGTSRFAYSTRNLIGASADEVAQFAVQYAERNARIESGTPQALLARGVKREELPTLGFQCISFASIEQPPLMLVILKGDFVGGGGMGGNIKHSYSYLAYIFDVWSAEPAFQGGSINGSDFRIALNDASIPTPVVWQAPEACPNEGRKYLHYGDTAPTPPRQDAPPAANPTPSYTTPLPPSEVTPSRLH